MKRRGRTRPPRGRACGGSGHRGGGGSPVDPAARCRSLLARRAAAADAGPRRRRGGCRWRACSSPARPRARCGRWPCCPAWVRDRQAASASMTATSARSGTSPSTSCRRSLPGRPPASGCSGLLLPLTPAGHVSFADRGRAHGSRRTRRGGRAPRGHALALAPHHPAELTAVLGDGELASGRAAQDRAVPRHASPSGRQPQPLRRLGRATIGRRPCASSSSGLDRRDRRLGAGGPGA